MRYWFNSSKIKVRFSRLCKDCSLIKMKGEDKQTRCIRTGLFLIKDVTETVIHLLPVNAIEGKCIFCVLTKYKNGLLYVLFLQVFHLINHKGSQNELSNYRSKHRCLTCCFQCSQANIPGASQSSGVIFP